MTAVDRSGVLPPFPEPASASASARIVCQWGLLHRRSALFAAPQRQYAIGMATNMMSDPRVFFAAERTLLAWVRTGLTIMAFGFVVARFGLFLRLLAVQQGTGAMDAAMHNHVSNVIGIALVLIGVGCMILGAVQHHSYVATLPPGDVPRSHAAVYPISLSVVLALLGIVLAVYLAF